MQDRKYANYSIGTLSLCGFTGRFVYLDVQIMDIAG